MKDDRFFKNGSTPATAGARFADSGSATMAAHEILNDQLVVTPPFDLLFGGYFHGGKRIFTYGSQIDQRVFDGLGRLTNEFKAACGSRDELKPYIHGYHRLYWMANFSIWIGLALLGFVLGGPILFHPLPTW